MLATLIGGAAGGVAGALVATPLVGATKQLYLQLRWGQQPFASERPPLRDRVKTVFRTMVRRPARREAEILIAARRRSVIRSPQRLGPRRRCRASKVDERAAVDDRRNAPFSKQRTHAIAGGIARPET